MSARARGAGGTASAYVRSPHEDSGKRSRYCARIGSCHSPKFCPAAKSTACTLSSARQFAMTVLQAPLLPTVVRANDPLLSFASHTALGELGTPAATCSTKTKTSSSKTPPDGQALLGPGPPVLGRLEKVAPGRHPETVARWHRAAFRLYRSLISRVKKQIGRKRLSKEI